MLLLCLAPQVKSGKRISSMLAIAEKVGTGAAVVEAPIEERGASVETKDSAARSIGLVRTPEMNDEHADTPME